MLGQLPAKRARCAGWSAWPHKRLDQEVETGGLWGLVVWRQVNCMNQRKKVVKTDWEVTARCEWNHPVQHEMTISARKIRQSWNNHVTLWCSSIKSDVSTQSPDCFSTARRPRLEIQTKSIFFLLNAPAFLVLRKPVAAVLDGSHNRSGLGLLRFALDATCRIPAWCKMSMQNLFVSSEHRSHAD